MIGFDQKAGQRANKRQAFLVNGQHRWQACLFGPV